MKLSGWEKDNVSLFLWIYFFFGILGARSKNTGLMKNSYRESKNEEDNE